VWKARGFALGTLLIFGFCGAALAEAGDADSGSPLTLVWSAPAGCPSGESVRAEAMRLAEVEPDGTQRLTARASIRRENRSWTLELETEFEGGAGERVLRANSCGALADAASLTLALILNPAAELRSEGSAGPREPAANDNPYELYASLSGRAGVQAGLLDTPGPNFALGAGLSLGAPSLWLFAGFIPPSDAHVSGSSGPGGRVWAASSTLVGCWDFGTATPLGPCAGAELMRVEGRGIGVANPRRAVAYFASGTLGLRGGIRLGRRLVLRLEGFALVPAQRPSLFLDELGRVVRPGALGAKVHAGADFELR
jgi:hypothetical protein